MEKLVSVIVPIFRVEKEFVHHSIKSIKTQEYSNLEILIVDDGNEEEYAKWLDSFKDDRTEIIHQINGGVSNARNNALKLAKGEYVYFCDPDDLMEKDAIKRMLNCALTYKADQVICKYHCIDENGLELSKIEIEASKVEIYESEKIKDLVLELIAPGRELRMNNIDIRNNYCLVYPWGHLFHKNAVEGIEFPEGIHPGEDRIFNVNVLDNKCSRVVFINQPLHIYRIGYGVTARYKESMKENSLMVWNEIERIFENKSWLAEYHREYKKAKMSEISYLIGWYFFHTDNPKSYRARKRDLKKYLADRSCEDAICDINNPYYTYKQRIICILIRLHALWVFELGKKRN